MNTQAKRLREIINRPGAAISVGVWDPFSARVAEQEGFDILTLFGSLLSFSMIGTTDYGYITQTEMVDATRRMVQAVSVPVVVDCDDGFGDPANVRRTVQLLEQVGAAGMYLEDLKRPLRCSALGGGSLVPPAEMEQKVKAAIDARSDPDFFLMARTDDYEGVDDVIARADRYGRAGIDMVLVIGLTRVEDMEKVARAATVPLATIQAPSTKMPMVAPADLEAMGYKMIYYVPTLFTPAAMAMRDAARQLKKDLEDRTRVPRTVPGLTMAEVEGMVGLEEDIRLQEKYSVTGQAVGS
jgi:2-methylisocitrate lyase-like PEP mutase family enzyme